MQRVIAYVDGFNLYFGLKDSQFKKYYWLDLPAMAVALLTPDQQLVATHYFTARIRTNGRSADDAKRQTNIAAEMLADAYEDRFDTAFVISGDSDLTTPIQQVRKRFPNKRLIVVFPPNRQSAQLKKAANGYLSIGEDKLRQNQLPNTVMTSSGFALHRPTHWK